MEQQQQQQQGQYQHNNETTQQVETTTLQSESAMNTLRDAMHKEQNHTFHNIFSIGSENSKSRNKNSEISNYSTMMYMLDGIPSVSDVKAKLNTHTSTNDAVVVAAGTQQYQNITQDKLIESPSQQQQQQQQQQHQQDTTYKELSYQGFLILSRKCLLKYVIPDIESQMKDKQNDRDENVEAAPSSSTTLSDENINKWIQYTHLDIPNNIDRIRENFNRRQFEKSDHLRKSGPRRGSSSSPSNDDRTHSLGNGYSSMSHDQWFITPLSSELFSSYNAHTISSVDSEQRHQQQHGAKRDDLLPDANLSIVTVPEYKSKDQEHQQQQQQQQQEKEKEKKEEEEEEEENKKEIYCDRIDSPQPRSTNHQDTTIQDADIYDGIMKTPTDNDTIDTNKSNTDHLFVTPVSSDDTRNRLNDTTSSSGSSSSSSSRRKRYQARRTIGNSEVAHVCNINNFVKSALLSRAAELLKHHQRQMRYSTISSLENRERYVLDIGCGRGQDVSKLDYVSPDAVIFGDISEASLVEAEYRWRKTKYKNPSSFISVNFCASDFLQGQNVNIYRCNPDRSKGDARKPVFYKSIEVGERTFQFINCQMAAHYAFQNYRYAQNFISSISKLLMPGGIFIVSVPDAQVISKMLMADSGNFYQNSLFKLIASDLIHDQQQQTWSLSDKSNGDSKSSSSTNTTTTTNTLLPTGTPYRFTFNQVIECDEYIVRTQDLIGMAKRQHLDLMWQKNFLEFVLEEQSKQEHKNLSERMKIDLDAVSKDQQEALSIFTMLCFRKSPSQNATKTSANRSNISNALHQQRQDPNANDNTRYQSQRQRSSINQFNKGGNVSVNAVPVPLRQIYNYNNNNNNTMHHSGSTQLKYTTPSHTVGRVGHHHHFGGRKSTQNHRSNKDNGRVFMRPKSNNNATGATWGPRKIFVPSNSERKNWRPQVSQIPTHPNDKWRNQETRI